MCGGREYVKTEEEEMQEAMEGAAEQSAPEDPDWIKNAEEKLPTKKGNYKLSIFLSTDGKHTVNVEVEDQESRHEATRKAMELYDYILARYGTKQAQAVKEYAQNGNAQQINKEDCKHEQMKFMQSKTEKNPGRWFKSCATCKSFLGWQT